MWMPCKDRQRPPQIAKKYEKIYQFLCIIRSITGFDFAVDDPSFLAPSNGHNTSCNSI